MGDNYSLMYQRRAHVNRLPDVISDYDACRIITLKTMLHINP